MNIRQSAYAILIYTSFQIKWFSLIYKEYLNIKGGPFKFEQILDSCVLQQACGYPLHLKQKENQLLLELA